MIPKLLYGKPSREKVETKRIREGAEGFLNHRIGGMYFDTTTTTTGLPLLLPDESCLAEDESAVFHVHCEREGFHLFGWGDVDFNNIPAKIYLTTYRVCFVTYDVTDDS